MAIPLKMLIWQLTGERMPEIFAPKPKRARPFVDVSDPLVSGSVSRSNERVLVVMSKIRSWPESLKEQGFTAYTVETSLNCGNHVAREACERMFASGELEMLPVTRNKAHVYRRIEYGQIDSAA